ILFSPFRVVLFGSIDPPSVMPRALMFGPCRAFGGAAWPLRASPKMNPKRACSGEQRCIGSTRGQLRPVHDPEDTASRAWPWASGTGGGGAFAVHHPGHTELVHDHAEARGPECRRERHRDRPAGGQRIEDLLTFLHVVALDRQREALVALEGIAG